MGCLKKFHKCGKRMIKASLKPGPEPCHHHLYCPFVKLFFKLFCVPQSVCVCTGKQTNLQVTFTPN